MEPAAGGALMFVALLDLFLTVLYARAGAGFVSDQVARGTWVVFRHISKLFGRKRAIVLSLSGSFIVVALVAAWAMMLAVGAALIMHPYLGTSVRSSGGTNSGDFLTALYAGGSSMSMVGASNYSGDTPAFRIVYLLNSLIGMSVMSLALTYVMQIYSALQKRNAFGLTLELMSRTTGDAAVLIGCLGPQGQFSAGYTNLATLADQMVLIVESHDFYPVLFYFRFPEPRYSASRITLVSLDCVSLLRAALSEDSYSWLKNAASVNQLWDSSISLLNTLQHTFTPRNAPEELPQPNAEERKRWADRCVEAMRFLRTLGIETASSEEQAVETYIRMRVCWNKYVVDLASYMQWPMEQIDRALSEQSSTGRPSRGA